MMSGQMVPNGGRNIRRLKMLGENHETVVTDSVENAFFVGKAEL